MDEDSNLPPRTKRTTSVPRRQITKRSSKLRSTSNRRDSNNEISMMNKVTPGVIARRKHLDI